jgi:hypothetical protein
MSPGTEAFVSCSHCCGDVLIADGEQAVCHYCLNPSEFVWQPPPASYVGIGVRTSSDPLAIRQAICRLDCKPTFGLVEGYAGSGCA